MTDPKSPSADAATRDQLLAQWREARRRRDTAELGGEAWREAAEEIGRIEVEIARLDRLAGRV